MRRRRDHLDDALRTLAEAGLSTRDAAVVLCIPRGSVITRARIAAIPFQGANRPGPGCSSDQARKGWETRRRKGWKAGPRFNNVWHAR